MHIAPVVLIPHAVGPSRWVEALEELADTVSLHPGLPVTVRASGAAVEHVAREEAPLWGRLHRQPILWLAGGYTDPVLTWLPPAAAALQLEREVLAMDVAGITAGGLWVGDTWEPALVSLARDAALPLVLLDAAVLPQVPHRPAAVDRAGQAVITIPVMESVPDSWTDDALATVRVAPADLTVLADRHPGRLVTPDAYLDDHLPGGRLAPPVVSPSRHPERETFYRKLLGVTRDQGDRSTGRDAVMRLQSREHLRQPAGPQPDRDLIDARRALDRARHRGDSWVEVREVDWDGDGLDEVWVETPEQTLVVDPTAGSLEVWDAKALVWPITDVAPALSGLILRRLGPDGDEPPALRLTVEGRTEGRSQASVTLAHPRAGSCRVELTGRTLALEFAVAPTEPVRVGPEIPLNLAGVKLRADGGEWMAVRDPVAVAGHRFRLADEDRTMLVASPRPCELFVRPLAGRGVVIWPNWLTRGRGTYRLALTPS